MLLSVGQNVMHPTHGAGTITDLTEMDVVDGFNRYYVIEFDDKRLTLHVPVKTADDSYVRKVMTETKMDKVIDKLCSMPQELPDNFKSRRKKIEDRINSGLPIKVAEAVRDLAWREDVKGLSTLENRLYSQGKEMLTTEMALASDLDSIEARKEIDQALAEAVKAKNATIEKEPEAA